MATTARPLRLPPSVQVKSYARPRSHRGELQLVLTEPSSGVQEDRASARGADEPSSDWVDASFPRRAARVAVPPPVLTVLTANLVLGAAALTWLLPSPWGGLVPAAVLVQLVGWRHGASVALGGLLIGGGIGSLLGPLLGLGDWRRSALALVFVLLPAMLAWPARASAPVVSGPR